MQFKWASNQAKVDRAVRELTDANKIRVANKQPEVEITEEAVKAVYVRLLGHVIENPIEHEEGAETPEPIVNTPRRVRRS